MPLDLFSLEGRTALITGGNGGLGLAMAEGLKQNGARVVATGRDPKKNAAIGQRLHAPDVVYEMDVYDESSVELTVAKVMDRFGGVNILINNAGIGRKSVLTDLSLEEWESTVHVNLTGAFLCSKHVARTMKTVGKGGKIINIGSLYSLVGVPNSVAYGATKHGIVGLTRAMAVELGAYNIQVNAILPGWCETAMTQHLKTSPLFDFVRRKTPAGRWGNPQDMVGAAVFLAGAGSDFVTGAVLSVDGGYSVTERLLYD
jgi:2-dehydro-3-deoxy-D-gluconate 5-dehydrogenase